MIADRDDRKFAALAAAAKTPLVTNENHVLAQQRAVGIEILSPRAFVARERGIFMNALCIIPEMDEWVQGQLFRPIPTEDAACSWYADAAQYAVFSRSPPSSRSPHKELVNSGFPILAAHVMIVA